MEKSEEFSDRRQHLRISTTSPISLQLCNPTTLNEFKIYGHITGLCEGGISFSCTAILNVATDLHFDVYLPGTSVIFKAKGRVIWKKDYILNYPIKKSKIRYGIQFIEINDPYESELKKFISTHVLELDNLQERRITHTIVSELINFRNSRGMNIVGFYDHLKSNNSDAPFIIIVPGYSETKRDGLYLSYYFAQNGFNVIRYDHTDHVGESDGDILYTTLSKMRDDLKSTLDFIESTFGVKEVGVVSSSMGGRVAIKAASEDRRIALLVCMVSVVNLQHTLFSVYREDLIGETIRGKKWGLINVLGFEVDADAFLCSAIKDNFHDLESTKKDIRKIDCPIDFFVAAKDPWVNKEDASTVFRASITQRKEFHIIPLGLHRLYENQTALDFVHKRAVVNVSRYFYRREISLEKVIKPDYRKIVIQNRAEKERLKNRKSITKDDEKCFWERYLNKFTYIVNIPDYWHFLDFILRLLGGIKENEKILDVGCGNGNFGTFLLINLTYKIKGGMHFKEFPVFSYTGVDFAENAINQARQVHNDFQEEFKAGLGFRNNHRILIGCSYVITDIEYPLGFKDDSFDKICCNLVVSYVKNPQFTVRELFRVLSPGGKIIVTSLKPYADLTEIYTNFLNTAVDEKEIEEARKLLNNSGMIKYKETEGFYNFFSEKELINLLMNTGAKNIKTYKSFSNQANIIVAEKD